MTTIFLTGATGYIGGSVGARLLASGYKVRGLVRTEASAALLAARGYETVLGSLDDHALLVREAAASDGVINAASADHRDALVALLSGLRGSNKPLLHTSGSSVIGDDARGGRRSETVFDESTPFVVSSTKQPRREIDLMVMGAASEGVRSAVVCPSLIYGVGKGLNPLSVQLPFLASNAREHGTVQLVGAGLNVWSNVHIDDLADLYLLVFSKTPGGSFYFAENGEASFREMGVALAKRLGLPGVEALAPEAAAEQWGESKAYYSLGSNSRVRAVRARNELDWKPQHASVIDWILQGMP